MLIIMDLEDKFTLFWKNCSNSSDMSLAFWMKSEISGPFSFRLQVNIGADHRVLDGATVARFCNEWKRFIENPDLVMLHMR